MRAVSRGRLVAPALAAAILVAATATRAQGGPALHTDARCYLAGQQVQITGSGFTPQATYTVTLDRHRLGTGTVKPDGSVAGTLSSGSLPPGRRRIRRRLQVYDGQLQGRTAFSVTAFAAGFAPSTGDPRTLVVRYSVLGIGVSARRGSIVYVHYVKPGGHLQGTLPIGRTAGECGSLTTSRPHRLFPFRAVPGTWQLQFDLASGYSPRRRPRIVRTVSIG